jgi:hypothetical protein
VKIRILAAIALALAVLAAGAFWTLTDSWEGDVARLLARVWGQSDILARLDRPREVRR